MSLIVLLLAAAVLTALEKYWAPWALGQLRFRGTCDKICAEPDEIVTWSATVENGSRLPIPFVRLQQSFPEEIVIHADARWLSSHRRKGIRKWFIEERLSLAPRQACTRTVRFSCPHRGVYMLAGYELSAGDLLGIEEKSMAGGAAAFVIIPRWAKSRTSLDALGGFMGDISVRRFILEDPILTVGFRDYTGREPMKSISWTRTATTGSLQVKQFDHTAEQNVMILLNVEGGTPAQLEGCFSLMRTVCEELEKKKIPFGLRTNGNLSGPVGNIFHMAEGRGSRHISTILYALGCADYTCFQSFRYLARQTLLHRRNNESYIVITPALTEQTNGILHTLEAAVGSPICILTGESEVEVS